METEISGANYLFGIPYRLFHVAAPVVLISVGYVDLGKWAATIEGGARFGCDLVVLLILFNFAAILCQYLAAHIGLVSERDLAKICSAEYGKGTCFFIGVQAELSMIALDLTMVLGIAHAANLVFGMDLSTAVFLTAIDAVLFPVFSTLLNFKAEMLCICIAAVTLFLYVIGVLFSQPEIPLSVNWMITKLNEESVFTLMSLLGASIMPHNFYLHSSIVQKHRGSKTVPKSALCHAQFFAIICIFSGIFMVNYVLMNSAANVFHSTGLVLLTFQDAMSLMDQVFRSPIASPVVLLLLLFSAQITSSIWCHCGQVVLHEFFRLDIPSWFHRAIIRILSIIPAIYYVWNFGAEGLYQLLIFTQVMVALVLPSSVIPLFRVASSRPIMGVHKISQVVEFLALITFVGMLGLKLVFMLEIIFGNSEWVGLLKWNSGNSISLPYFVLVITSIASFCLTLWLVATPLKSASVKVDTQIWDWEMQNELTKARREDRGTDEAEPFERKEGLPILEKSSHFHGDASLANFDLKLPESSLDNDQEMYLTHNKEKYSDVNFQRPSISCPKEVEPMAETVSTVVKEPSNGKLQNLSSLKSEPVDPIPVIAGTKGESQNVKKDEDQDTWDPGESNKGACGPLSRSEASGSFKSLSTKNDEGGNSVGSLSRLAGLGRAARRQLASVLEEFWGQLYDFHGQATPEAKAKKLDALLGVNWKLAASIPKEETPGKDFTGYLPLAGGSSVDSLINSGLYASPKKHLVQAGVDSSHVTQRQPSSMWSTNQMKLLDAYLRSSSGERRYSSLHLPPSSDSSDFLSATIDGYKIASYVNRIGKERNPENLDGQFNITSFGSPTVGPSNYRDHPSTRGQEPQEGTGSIQGPSFPLTAASRNRFLQPERPLYDRCTSGLCENAGTATNAKKYYSLPDISGLAAPYRDSYLSDRMIGQCGNLVGIGPSFHRTTVGQSLCSNIGSRVGNPLAFNQLSPSKASRDAFSLRFNSNTGSLWSRQPFEQFGVADRTSSAGTEGVGTSLGLASREVSSVVDREAKLLQSLRLCILKLLKLEGSDWLFSQNDGADEDLIDCVAARERFLYEAEIGDTSRVVHACDSDRKSNSASKNDDVALTKLLVSSIPHCGEGCVWKADLIVSFGVWCIHRILDLSLMESRPELWGKYTYVLNRLQGIIDPAFSRIRSPLLPCFCLQIPAAHKQRLSSPSAANGMLPPTARPGRGKCTTAAMLVDLVKDVETAISSRKGRTGTAAGDVAFPKGKENLASVLKRYKRRLSLRPAAVQEVGSGPRKIPASAPYGGSQFASLGSVQ